MRTAEEIINKYVKRGYGYIKKDILSAINEARIEAIKEAAEVGAIKYEHGGTVPYFDKQSILNLINEVK